MSKRFFIKDGRPTKDEKRMATEISYLLSSAPDDKRAYLQSLVEKRGVVNNADGLRQMLNDIKSVLSNGAHVEVPPSQQSTQINSQSSSLPQGDDEYSKQGQMNSSMKNINTENMEEVSIEQEEPVQFEETINIQEESQLQEPVIEREDTFGHYQDQNPNQGETVPPTGGQEIDDDTSYTDPKDEGDAGSGNDTEDTTGGSEGGGEGGNLKGMPSHTKRKAINKTAEIVSNIYGNVLPMIPKWIAKIPESKVERMAWNNELDPNMKLEMEDGSRTTVGKYINEYNENLDNTLVITEEQKKEFEECLKDVLEEKDVAMTPTQRLVSVVVAQTFTLMAIGIQNTVVMRGHLDHWKEVHAERQGKNKPPKQETHTASDNVKKDNTSSNGSSQNVTKKDEEHTSQEETDEVTINPNTVVEK